MSTDWDIDYYKTDYESDEHWSLRKTFMETHKDKFPENELVCLAQVFANVELLGCRYPDKTMQKVALLSKEVASEYRKSRETTIKRTFVAASDAAGAKVKGRSSGTSRVPTNNKNTQIAFVKSTTEEEEEFIVKPTTSTATLTQQSTSTTKQTNQSQKTYHEINQSNPRKRKFESHSQNAEPSRKTLNNPGFIIYETIGSALNAIHTLQVSAAKQGANFRCETEIDEKTTSPICAVYINNMQYGAAPITGNKKEAKQEACTKALEYAKKINYTVRQKESNKTVKVALPETDGNTDSTITSSAEKDDGKLSETNKGFKMLKMLGWKGGALGTDGTGIQEPINIELKIDRKGLGLPANSGSDSNSKLNHDFFNSYLLKYKDDVDAIYDLVFSKEFDKEERKSLHEIANRLGLKSRSRNDTDGRYLVISKKITLQHLANDIYNGGLYSEVYDLILPTDPLPVKQKPTNNNETKHSNVPNTSKNIYKNNKKKFNRANKRPHMSI